MSKATTQNSRDKVGKMKPSRKTTQKTDNLFSDEERAAMKEAVRERKASRAGAADGEQEVLAKIAEMAAADRALAERLHTLIKATAPSLSPKTWYGMPAYARDGDVVCFFQPAGKFKVRYATLGFSDEAKLDDGHMWPTVYAITELTPSEEARVVALVKKALS
jgi:uncharacterized protein YdhG (YjbR/CyaY superfamily)